MTSIPGFKGRWMRILACPSGAGSSSLNSLKGSPSLSPSSGSTMILASVMIALAWFPSDAASFASTKTIALSLMKVPGGHWFFCVSAKSEW